MAAEVPFEVSELTFEVSEVLFKVLLNKRSRLLSVSLDFSWFLFATQSLGVFVNHDQLAIGIHPHPTKSYVS